MSQELNFAQIFDFVLWLFRGIVRYDLKIFPSKF